MELKSPIFFEPLFMERVWGGNALETLFGKKLPPGSRIGESWEIVDREEAQSVVHEGALRGATLQELWTGHRAEVFGEAYVKHPSQRFPLLFKLLDAHERLSVQVHPPAEIAPLLEGEPKTEMWYIVDTKIDYAIFAGVEKGVTRESFAKNLQEGTVEEVVQRLEVKAGDAIFIPSGRLHAIGAGNVIVEVQQNSDTTYRVFDWNRLGLDGLPRELHVEQSLQSIDYTDTNPQLCAPIGESIVRCEYFEVERWNLEKPRAATDGKFAIFTVLNGTVKCAESIFKKGDFFLVPASQTNNDLVPLESDVTLLRTTLPVAF